MEFESDANQKGFQISALSSWILSGPLMTIYALQQLQEIILGIILKTKNKRKRKQKCFEMI